MNNAYSGTIHNIGNSKSLIFVGSDAPLAEFADGEVNSMTFRHVFLV